MILGAVLLKDPPPDPGGRDTQLGLPFQPEGSFHHFGPAKALLWSGAHSNLEEADSASTDPLVGTLRSSPFTAPAFLKFYLSGYPSAAAMRVYLQDVHTGRTLDLVNAIDPGPMWRLRQWKLSQAWRGHPVILVVHDGGAGPMQWVGITEVHKGARPWVNSIERALHRDCLLVVLAGAFLLPGFAVLLTALRLKARLNLARAMALTMGGSALAAYLVFWVFLWSRNFGDLAACTILGASSVCVLMSLMRTVPLPALPKPFFPILGAVLLVAVFYNSLGFIYDQDSELDHYTQNRYVVHTMPPDNILQELFAERVYDLDKGEEALTKPLISNWHTSDRPPLQTAITLFEMPFTNKTTRALHYQLLGVFLQCTWLAGLWTLLYSLGVRHRYLASSIAFCAVSHFFLMHSFYVWAKLLAAAFCMAGLSFFPFRARMGRWTPLDVSLAGSMFGFALLCHPGAMFTIVPATLLIYRKRPSLRMVALGCASLIALQLPWMAYQKYIDPPGDSLIREHLSGGVDPHHTLLQSIWIAYSGLTMPQFLTNKAANVGALFGGGSVVELLSNDWRTSLSAFVACNFFYLPFALGFLGVGLLVRLFGGPRRALLTWRIADRLVLIVIATLALWCLVMFQPGSTIIHQGSFATELLLFASCVLYLQSTPTLFRILLAVQTLVFFPLFVFVKDLLVAAETVSDNSLDPGMAVIALLCFFVLAYLYWRSQMPGRFSAGYLPLRAPTRAA